MSSKHPLYPDPTPEQQKSFDDALQRCRDKGIDPFAQVECGAYVADDGTTFDVSQIKSNWQIEAAKTREQNQ